SEKAGKLSVNSLKGRAEIQRVVESAYVKFFPYNALFTRQEKAAAQIENQVLDMCLSLFNGGSLGCANLTSGGTESIFCALHAMRQWARATRPQITEPEILAPYSLHATFNKTAHFLGIKVVRIPVGEDLLADVDEIQAAINENTIGLAASAPSWPYGLVDPIEAMGKLAQHHELWLHVDACVGGYILPFMRKLDCTIPGYDFSVAGVSSISADLHKYGYAPKPCSTILYRSSEQQRYHYVPVTEWPCGLYLSQAFMGSRPLASTAAAWAVMNYLGERGYVENARQILSVKDKIQRAVGEIDGLATWETHGPLMMIKAEPCHDGSSVNIESVTGAMRARGWVLLGVMEPPALHLTVDPMEEEALQQFIADLIDVTAKVREGDSSALGSLNYGGAGGSQSPKWLLNALAYMDEAQLKQDN
ncbi:MAG: aminotransferase class V-fold PLP-dependent enzyme, partial [Gammaproteobacteria bacterium]|nr:aminotransferase class V-fold PLP-dependent enzyme [Gammaproteobacteria bacterium]